MMNVGCKVDRVARCNKKNITLTSCFDVAHGSNGGKFWHIFLWSFLAFAAFSSYVQLYIVQMDSKIIIIWVKNNQLFFSES